MEDTVSETTMSKTTSGEANKQPVEKPSRSVIAKNSGLKKCFSALVDRKQIPLNKLDPELATILPYMVVHYVKSWPGWQRSVEYYSGKTSFKAWYEKFYKYITLKLSQVVELHYGQAQAEIRKKRFELYAEKIATKKICNRNSQTDSLAPKGFAPFTIEVTGKPLLLNTIVFTDTSEGDILLKQHSVLDWDQNIAENITVRQIITWPNVGVHLSSPVFSFSRKNLHEIARHISVVGTALPNLHPKLIEEIGIIDQAEERQVYTLDYLRRMLTDLLAAFSCVIKSKPVIDAFQVIFDEFLADIEEINVLVNEKVTMASNTFVLFNIGGHLYFRNKKLSKGAPSRYDIGFTEMIIPKMQTALVSLSAPDKFRAYIDELKGLAACKENVQPNITFTCEYCSERYESIKTLACHLKDLHKMEQPMLCVSCKKSFSAFNLSKTRWSHACPKKAASRDDVGYTELVIPRMETSLIHFASSSKFKNYFNQLRNFDPSSPDNDPSLVPQISFSCNFCMDSFETLDLLVAHLSELHKMEPAMLCAKCKRSLSPFHLARSRWGHSCLKR